MIQHKMLLADLYIVHPGKAEQLHPYTLDNEGEPWGNPNPSQDEIIENKDVNPSIASNSKMASNRKEDKAKESIHLHNKHRKIHSEREGNTHSANLC